MTLHYLSSMLFACLSDLCNSASAAQLLFKPLEELNVDHLPFKVMKKTASYSSLYQKDEDNLDIAVSALHIYRLFKKNVNQTFSINNFQNYESI